MKILMCEHFPLEHEIKVGSHHICRHLCRDGHEVFWIADPFHVPRNPLRLLNDPLVNKQIQRWRKGVYKVEGALTFAPFTATPWVDLPLLRSRLCLGLSLRLLYPRLVATLSAHGFDKPDILWLTFPKFAAIRGMINHRFLVHRVSDLYEAHSTFPPAIDEIERELLENSDLVLAVSRDLTDRARAINPRSFCMPNGVELQDFAVPPVQRPAALAAMRGPVFLYVGGVHRDVIDRRWVIALARRFPDASVVLLGPGDLTIDDFGAPPNLFLPGPRPYESIPSFVRSADVGIIPFLDSPRTRDAGHHKVLQYFAGGLPAVGRNLPGLSSLGSPALLADNERDFAELAGKALAGGRDKPAFAEYAASRSWDDWMRRLYNHLEELMRQESPGQSKAQSLTTR